MDNYITDEKTGIDYNLHGDYYLPNLELPETEDIPIGIFGRQRLDYLKNHRRVLYVNLLTSGKLYEHLREIDTAAFELWDNLIRQMAETQGVTEGLKAENQMEWVGRMNNIRACAHEIVCEELVYQ